MRTAIKNKYDEDFLTIVVPAHNEEQRIDAMLSAYAPFFRDKTKKKELSNFKIIVVINACRDNTIGIVKKYEEKYPEITDLNVLQAGKGLALLRGFRKAKGRFVGFVDADLATPPESFYDLLKNIDNFDGVIAARWLKGSIIKTPQTLLRKITSKGFNFLVRSLLFLPFADTQCGAKLFRKEALDSVIDQIGITQWAFDIDLLYRLKKKGFKVKEIPTIWEDKKGGKLNLTKVPFQMFASIVRLRLIHSPFRFVVRFYNVISENFSIDSR